jgi:hypothetical protein
MKKCFMALVTSAVVCSMAFASPSANEPSFTGLNATEHAALFGEGSTAQVVALDGVEMKATEGEALPAIMWALGMTYAVYANAPSNINAKVYSTWPNQQITYIGIQYTLPNGQILTTPTQTITLPSWYVPKN